MAVYKRGKVWWYKFTFGGDLIRASTKQGNRRVAEQIEAAAKTQLAKGEVGIRDRKPAPTLKTFTEDVFLPFVRQQKKSKPRMIRFYEDRVARLKTFPRLWNKHLDTIEAEDISAFVSARQSLELQTSTINRDLATLRRIFRIAAERKAVTVMLPAVKLLAGENRRERVISSEEETAYLEAASPLLHDFAILELDCGLRPEEAYSLTWARVRDGNIEVHSGKTRDARRSVPASPRVTEMLIRRRQSDSGPFVFAAATKTGHIDVSSIRKQHLAALKASEVEHFVIYAFRHTCLTRWAALGMDTFTLKKLAGHGEIATTSRYVHMNDPGAREFLEKTWNAPGGHKTGHNDLDGADNDRKGKRLKRVK